MCVETLLQLSICELETEGHSSDFISHKILRDWLKLPLISCTLP
jgi:hypothetical protein